jgi:hypothetical protein
LHKLLIRIKRTLYANYRDVKSRSLYLGTLKDSKTQVSLLESEIKDLESRISLKEEFLNWLVEFAVTSLFPGGSPSRRSCSLDIFLILNEMEQIVVDTTYSVNLNNQKSFLLNRRCTKALLNTIFNDTYEPNRDVAYSLLLQSRSSLPEFSSQELLESLLNQGLSMINRIRVVDVDSGAMIVRLIFKKCVIGQNKALFFSQGGLNHYSDHPISKKLILYYFITLMTQFSFLSGSIV